MTEVAAIDILWILFFVILFFIFCMFRVHKGQGCMMSLLGHSLISNIYKTHMSHQCHLEREGNFNANTGAFLKDVDVNHQAVTGSVRDDWRGPRGLAVGETMAGCVKTLRKSNAPGEVQESRTSNRNRCDNVAKPLINGTNVSAPFVFLIFRPLRPRGFLPPELQALPLHWELWYFIVQRRVVGAIHQHRVDL